MKPANYPHALLSLLVACSLGACTMAHPGPLWFAINPYTGEIRALLEGEPLPNGWEMCESEEDCPALLDCDALGEVACLLRPDCEGAVSQRPTAACLHEGDLGCVESGFAGCYPATILCSPTDCGPRPGALPVAECIDGSPAGYTGRCVWQETGHCVWEHRDCLVAQAREGRGVPPRGAPILWEGREVEAGCLTQVVRESRIEVVLAGMALPVLWNRLGSV